MKGHCLCGAVRWQNSGPRLWSAYCHCESCRRNCAAPVTADVGMPSEAHRWTGETAARFVSAPGVTRSFCARCGTPMAYESERFPGEVHLYAATLDDPEDFRPERHVHHAEYLGWLRIDDALPRHAAGDNKGDNE